MNKEKIRFKAIAFRTDTLGGDFIKGKVYEADDVALDAENERYYDCKGSFESLVKENPRVVDFLYHIQDGEDEKHVRDFIENIKEGDCVTLDGWDYDFKVIKVTAYGVFLRWNPAAAEFYRFERIGDIKFKEAV